jgi:hypothetical protein
MTNNVVQASDASSSKQTKGVSKKHKVQVCPYCSRDYGHAAAYIHAALVTVSMPLS